jgi:hypothetical protein
MSCESAPTAANLGATPQTPEDGVRPDRLDIEPHDREQLQEIQMLADLILASSARLTRLSDAAIDIALGLSDATGQSLD